MATRHVWRRAPLWNRIRRVQGSATLGSGVARYAPTTGRRPAIAGSSVLFVFSCSSAFLPFCSSAPLLLPHPLAVADTSLRLLTRHLRSGLGLENRGPSCSHRVRLRPPPPRGATRRSLANVLRHEKTGSARLRLAGTLAGLWRLEPPRLIHLKSARGGSPTKRRATRTDLAKQQSCWSGGRSNQSLLSL